MSKRHVVCCLLVVSLGYSIVPSISIAQDNSSSVTVQMNKVKTIADRLKQDAVQMEAYTRSNNTTGKLTAQR